MKTNLLHQPGDEMEGALVCEYIRNADVLRLTFPAVISPEDLKEKIDILTANFFPGARSIAKATRLELVREKE